MVQYLEKEKEEMAQNAKLEIESLNGALQRQKHKTCSTSILARAKHSTFSS